MDLFDVIASVGGAIVVAVSSNITLLIQSRNQTKRELKKTAAEMAVEDFRFRVQDQTGKVGPLSASALILYYDRLIELSDKGQLNRNNILKLLRNVYTLQQSLDQEGEKLRQRDEDARK